MSDRVNKFLNCDYSINDDETGKITPECIDMMNGDSESVSEQRIHNNRIFLTKCKVNNLDIKRAINTFADCTIISPKLRGQFKLQTSNKEQKVITTDTRVSQEQLIDPIDITLKDNTYSLYNVLISKNNFTGFDILFETNVIKKLNAVMDCKTRELIFVNEKNAKNHAISYLNAKDCFTEKEMDITPEKVVCQKQFFLDRDPKKTQKIW
uniref:Uncharacterized protein n=1 Tax=Strongyloides stercoralis TaxID=6248 RepID=A0AAF5DIB6_STRER